jgi:hypothetical protein
MPFAAKAMKSRSPCVVAVRGDIRPLELIGHPIRGNLKQSRYGIEWIPSAVINPHVSALSPVLHKHYSELVPSRVPTADRMIL